MAMTWLVDSVVAKAGWFNWTERVRPSIIRPPYARTKSHVSMVTVSDTCDESNQMIKTKRESNLMLRRQQQERKYILGTIDMQQWGKHQSFSFVQGKTCPNLRVAKIVRTQVQDTQETGELKETKGKLK